MGLLVQPVSTTDPTTGAALVPAVSTMGQMSVVDDCLRRIQEAILLHQQANLLSMQLAREKTAVYTFIEVR